MADSQHAAVDALPDLTTGPGVGTQAEDDQHSDPGHSSQRSLASAQPAQEGVQPQHDDGEATAAESQRLLSDDELRNGDEQGSPPAEKVSGLGNTRGSDGPATEDLVTLPLATLQQLVQYCAQLVNESKSLKTRAPDLERDGISNSEPIPGNRAHAEADSRSHPNLFNLDENDLDTISDDAINRTEEIWKEVVPWQLQEVPLLSDEMIEQEEPILARCRTTEEIHILFKDLVYVGQEESKNAALRLRYLISGWEDSGLTWGERAVRPPFNYGVMVTLLTGLKYGRLTIGSILQRCYQVRSLAKPNILESRSFLDQIWAVVLAFLYLNTTFSFSWYFAPAAHPEYAVDMYYGRKLLETLFTRRKSLEEVLGLSLPQLCRVIHAAAESNKNKAHLEAASGLHFRVKDLTIESLRVIGGLSIVWTPFLEDHLRLDLNKRVLYVLWHQPEHKSLNRSLLPYFENILIAHLPPERLDAPNHVSLDVHYLIRDIRLSWAILFTKGSRYNRKNLAAYSQVPPPPWVSGNNGDYQKSLHLADYDTAIHELDEFPQPQTLRTYSEFHIFETRMRRLVFYMDTQKPQGIRQLWRDKRDTLNYYTFWGVIIFGGLSVFLALFSLAVSIAQTVAGFRALNLGPSLPAPSR